MKKNFYRKIAIAGGIVFSLTTFFITNWLGQGTIDSSTLTFGFTFLSLIISFFSIIIIFIITNKE